MKKEILDIIVSLARASQVLIFGEVHGTREVPQLISQLLDILPAYGFGILGLELPHSEQDQLKTWALGGTTQPPKFFTHPTGDGRGNEQVLDLVRAATDKEWLIVCFDDVGFVRATWQQRDRAMADTLLKEWNQNDPEKKILCICGNLHSRLFPASQTSEQYWPSFAFHVQSSLKSKQAVKSINLVFHQGSFYNTRLRKIKGTRINEAYFSADGNDGHSITIHLPTATPATHLAKPLSMFSRFAMMTPTIISNFIDRLKPN